AAWGRLNKSFVEDSLLMSVATTALSSVRSERRDAHRCFQKAWSSAALCVARSAPIISHAYSLTHRAEWMGRTLGVGVSYGAVSRSSGWSAASRSRYQMGMVSGSNGQEAASLHMQ